ncbi:TonB-dependent siderophore receptor, partial [Acaryochloris sp. IP29b_bin.137]|uniref:TonB-dependent siderophore receptor n=1 Tax=Acaryochloris sp. IP29b_bin.137 TaxID=2969217 RepID=UPI0026379F6D
MRYLIRFICLLMPGMIPILLIPPSIAFPESLSQDPSVDFPLVDEAFNPLPLSQLPPSPDNQTQAPPAQSTDEAPDSPTQSPSPTTNPPDDSNEGSVPLAQITNILVKPIQDGLQVVLVTSNSASPKVFQFQEQNALFVDVVGAQLALSDNTNLTFENPLPSISSISVQQISDQEIRIKVFSNVEKPLNAYLERAAEALKLDVVPPSDSASTSELEFGNNLRIIVSADPLPRYQVPTASAGTRTNTDVLDIPQGIQIIPKAVLKDQGNKGLGESLRNTSGVNIGRAAGLARATTPIIRGFETDNLLRNGLRDDTLRISSGVNNIERIEVLKGPSSVLFGAGNLGGTINLVTETPLEEPLYNLEFKAGNYKFYGGSFDFTGPLNESKSLGYRLNFAYESRLGITSFENSDFFFISPSLQLINTDSTSLIVDFEYLSSRTRGDNSGLPAFSAIGPEGNTLIEDIVDSGVQISEEDLQRAGTLDISKNLGEPDISSSETNVIRVGYRFEHKFDESWKIRNEFLGSFQDTPQSSFVGSINFLQEAGQPNFNLLERIYLENPSYREAFTLNTNVVGDFKIAGIDQKLLFGVELFRELQEDVINQRLFFPFLSLESTPFNLFNPNYDPSRFFNDSDINLRPGTDTKTQTSSIGFYAQSQINFTDNLIVLLGGRLDYVKQFFVDRVNRADTSAIQTADTAFSPRFGIIYKPIEDLSLYASYTRSFNPTIGRGETGEIFIPEKGKQIEFGVKAKLLDDRITTSLAYYQLRRTNVLTQDPSNLGFQVQVGEQASDGVEFDIAGEILPGWNIIANYAYTNARISQDNEFPDGLRLLNSPEHAASIWTSYEIQKGALEGLGLGFGLYFQGSRNGDLRRPFVIPSYTRADASIFYQRGGFRAQINIQNLFNTRYFEA